MPGFLAWTIFVLVLGLSATVVGGMCIVVGLYGWQKEHLLRGPRRGELAWAVLLVVWGSGTCLAGVLHLWAFTVAVLGGI